MEKFINAVSPLFTKLFAVATSRTFWTVAILTSQYIEKKIDLVTYVSAMASAVIAFRTSDLAEKYLNSKTDKTSAGTPPAQTPVVK